MTRYLVVMLDDDGAVAGRRWFDKLDDANEFARNCPLDTIIYIVEDE